MCEGGGVRGGGGGGVRGGGVWEEEEEEEEVQVCERRRCVRVILCKEEVGRRNDSLSKVFQFVGC